MSAISKADVLETFADLYDVFEDNKSIRKELDKVYDRLNALPSVTPEQRWIPCSIKRPQKGLMLVAFNDGDIDLLKQPTAYRRSDIVAWMPVEPYREERREE